MKRRGFSLFVLLFLTSIFTLKAQDKEAGLLLGVSQYQGDLSKSDYTLSETQPSFGGLFRYYFNPKINLKASISYGWLSGDDANYADEDRFRKKRNLSFKTHLLEGSVQAEYNILPFVSNSRLYKWAPYVFTGISVFNFNPKTEHKGSTVDLQPLGTEGQGTAGRPDKYSRTQISIPFGGGIKYSVGGGWNIGLEFGLRKTFTDYIDDVSDSYSDQYAGPDAELAADVADRSEEIDRFDNQAFEGGDGRGNPDLDDWYSQLGFTITKTFRKQKCMGFY